MLIFKILPQNSIPELYPSAFVHHACIPRPAGLSTAAYFLGSHLSDLLSTAITPALFLGAYWSLTLPPGRVGVVYGILLGVTWWASGLAYAVATLLPPENGMMTGRGGRGFRRRGSCQEPSHNGSSKTVCYCSTCIKYMWHSKCSSWLRRYRPTRVGAAILHTSVLILWCNGLQYCELLPLKLLLDYLTSLLLCSTLV